MAIKYFTKSEARAAAKTATVVKSARQIIMESYSAASDTDKFDVFLSHAKVDADLVLGVKKILEREGRSVYVDWENDAQLDRTNVTSETADVLRRRMRQSATLLYIATDSASSSKWMPWELGYFDGYRPNAVAILPLMDSANDKFDGQEYLGLYPKVTKDTLEGSTIEKVFVEDRKKWTTLEAFSASAQNWRNYKTS